MSGWSHRWVRRTLGVTTGLLLVSSSMFAYVLQGASVVTVDDAVHEFRASTAEPTEGDRRTRIAADPTTASTSRGAGTGTYGAAANPAAGTSAGADGDLSAPSGAVGSGAGQPVSPAGTRATTPTKSVTTTSERVAEGVYTYDTDGYEATDALGGSRHDYPEQSPITVRYNDCNGFVQRWQPLAERWDESDLCVDDDGVTIRRFTTHHEFFQQGQTDEFLCEPGTYVYRRDARPGDAWSWACRSEATTFATEVTHIGTENLVIDGTTVAADRLRYDSTMTGGMRGTQLQERWIDPRTGLLLRMTTDIDTEADSPFGLIHYEEHYVLDLAALEPVR